MLCDKTLFLTSSRVDDLLLVVWLFTAKKKNIAKFNYLIALSWCKDLFGASLTKSFDNLCKGITAQHNNPAYRLQSRTQCTVPTNE